MAGRHRFAGRALLPARRIQRATELVDARSQRAHLLTADAVAAGRRPQGSYVALCGQRVLPASLTVGPEHHCLSCQWWRVARV
ncbi:MAG: hypothetical protein ACRDTJ_24305 [Pseudonocardiaceae bacterium]